MKNNINCPRRTTSVVNVGGVKIGGENPVRIQSMTSTSTNDIEASVAQAERIADAGASLVRLTAQGVKEAEAIGKIRAKMRADGYTTPLVADIHFNPAAAFTAATTCEKVRINPGNFVDPARTFKKLTYTDEEYNAEIERVSKALVPFIDVCRKHGTAVRIGVNHGSLSDRIMSRYGDTPAGMVESAMEFLRVFTAENFMNVVISIKASNTVVMVETVRRLVRAMEAENMKFPLHLGVTEAGDGEDGRIKSAVGIGTLLSEGIGDTIRVSLSEEPENEIPVAEFLVRHIEELSQLRTLECNEEFDPLMGVRHNGTAVNGVGGTERPVVIANYEEGTSAKPDFFIASEAVPGTDIPSIVPFKHWENGEKCYPLFNVDELDSLRQCDAEMKWMFADLTTSIATLKSLADVRNLVIIGYAPADCNRSAVWQAAILQLHAAGVDAPVIMAADYASGDNMEVQVSAAAELGTPLMNGFGAGIMIKALNVDNHDSPVEWGFGILQAARLRTTKTEYISCPSCGRTLFDLQTTVKRVKEATSHLTHLKFGIMGCIVNGPGEMADADYGYVGAAAGKVSLYKGKVCVERNIPQEEAIPHLIELLKANNDWREP